MERRERGDDASIAGDSSRQEPAANGRDDKRDPDTGAGVGAGAGAGAGPGARRQATAAVATTEENLSALSNLRVASESEDVGTPREETPQAHDRPAFTRPSADDSSNRNKVRRTSSQAYPTTPQDVEDLDRVSKSSLSFILDDQAASARSDEFTSGGKRAAALITRSRSTGDLAGEATSAAGGAVAASSSAHFTTTGSGRGGRSSGKPGADGKRRARRPPSRICKHEGCEQYVVDQGLCVRHGGGKRCLTEGCTSRAKHQGRCWRHGGSTECKVPSCINRAKSRGFCWSHGGGTKCKFETCEKIAISNGLCWAHGGGKRCAVKGCMRQAYERTDNLCNNHYQERQHGAGGSVAEGDSDTVCPSNRYPDDEEKPPMPPSVQ